MRGVRAHGGSVQPAGILRIGRYPVQLRGRGLPQPEGPLRGRALLRVLFVTVEGREMACHYCGAIIETPQRWMFNADGEGPLTEAEEAEYALELRNACDANDEAHGSGACCPCRDCGQPSELCTCEFIRQTR